MLVLSQATIHCGDQGAESEENWGREARRTQALVRTANGGFSMSISSVSPSLYDNFRSGAPSSATYYRLIPVGSGTRCGAVTDTQFKRLEGPVCTLDRCVNAKHVISCWAPGIYLNILPARILNTGLPACDVVRATPVRDPSTDVVRGLGMLRQRPPAFVNSIALSRFE
jgi:hypothetical protein